MGYIYGLKKTLKGKDVAGEFGAEVYSMVGPQFVSFRQVSFSDEYFAEVEFDHYPGDEAIEHIEAIYQEVSGKPA